MSPGARMVRRSSRYRGGGGGGGGVPTTDLYAHYDAALGVTKDGSNNVSAWNDQSGNGRHMTVTATREPLWIASALNSLPGISFPGADGLLLPGTFAYKAAMLVFTYPTSTFTAPSVLSYGNGGFESIYGLTGDTTWHPAGFPASSLYRHNGVTQSSSASIAPLNAGHSVYFTRTTGIGWHGATIGNWFDYSNRWHGHICEMVFYSAVPSAPDQASLESYIASKYAL